MNTQVRHWITAATALVATIGASLAIFLGPVPSAGGPYAAGARSSLAAGAGDTSTRAAL